jgi:hypothetical protein
MLIGYARVSTGEQNLDLQVDALKQAGCEEVYTDEMSGIKAERPGLQKALAFARSGDTLVVWRLDRLGRSLKIWCSELKSCKSEGWASVVCMNLLIQQAQWGSFSSTSFRRWLSLSGISFATAPWQACAPRVPVADTEAGSTY